MEQGWDLKPAKQGLSFLLFKSFESSVAWPSQHSSVDWISSPSAWKATNCLLSFAAIGCGALLPAEDKENWRETYTSSSCSESTAKHHSLSDYKLLVAWRMSKHCWYIGCQMLTLSKKYFLTGWMEAEKAEAEDQTREEICLSWSPTTR
ncbi:unnamed protein product [Caretta caretta]